MSDDRARAGYTISLRGYVDLRFAELEKRISQHAELLRVAHERDKVTMDARLASMNEFRNALRDQTGLFVERKEMDLRLRPLETFVQEMRGRVAATMWGIGVFFVILQIVFRLVWSK